MNEIRYNKYWKHRQRKEFICWVVGHNWKHSQSEKTEKYGTWVYHNCGNPYFRSVSQWENKCRRCRTLTQDPHPPTPFYKWFWYSFKAIFSGFKYTKNDWKSENYYKRKTIKSFLFDGFDILWQFPEQLAGHMMCETEIPSLLYMWILDLQYWMYELEEKYGDIKRDDEKNLEV